VYDCCTTAAASTLTLQLITYRLSTNDFDGIKISVHIYRECDICILLALIVALLGYFYGFTDRVSRESKATSSVRLSVHFHSYYLNLLTFKTYMYMCVGHDHLLMMPVSECR